MSEAGVVDPTPMPVGIHSVPSAEVSVSRARRTWFQRGFIALWLRATSKPSAELLADLSTIRPNMAMSATVFWKLRTTCR